MIEPMQKNDAFLADVVATSPGDGFALWWLGQSGFLLKHKQRHLLFDPYLSDSLTHKYANTDMPHVRMAEQVVNPGRLSFINVATSTHNHTDHLDAQTLGPLMTANPKLELVIPEANRALVTERLGIDPAWPIGLDDRSCTSVAGFEFHGIAAAHEQLERDEHGRCRYLGYVVRFGQWTVYHSGDTLRYDGLAERLQHFAIDVAILPINGRTPGQRVAGNLDGLEAAQLAHDIGARLVVPCHYEMFAFNTASPDAFLAACERLNQPCRVLRCGERLDHHSIDHPAANASWK